MPKNSRSYRSLAAWIKANGGTKHALYLRLQKAGVIISEPHLRNVMHGRFDLSLPLAIQISHVTGVPVQNLVNWNKPSRRKTSDAAA